MSIIFELLAEICLELFLTVPEDSLALDDKSRGKWNWGRVFWWIAFMANLAFFGLFLLLLIFILKSFSDDIDLTGILLGGVMLVFSGFFGYRVFRFSRYWFLSLAKKRM